MKIVPMDPLTRRFLSGCGIMLVAMAGAAVASLLDWRWLAIGAFWLGVAGLLTGWDAIAAMLIRRLRRKTL